MTRRKGVRIIVPVNRREKTATGVAVGSGGLLMLWHIFHIAHIAGWIFPQKKIDFKAEDITITVTDSSTGKKNTIPLKEYMNREMNDSVKAGKTALPTSAAPSSGLVPDRVQE
jgi:hypothetical protein